MWLRRVAGLLPSGVRRALARQRSFKFAYEWAALQAAFRRRCDFSRLGDFPESEFRDALSNAEWDARWRAAAEEASHFQLAGPHGTSLACRQAIFHLAMLLKPRRVLEIGTYVGATTIVWQQAMRILQSEQNGELFHIDTVDIQDVNDPRIGPWAQTGGECSPREATGRLGPVDLVQFHVADSLDYLKGKFDAEPYDLIFFDGDHAAPRVYREICAATPRLRQAGHILLHDYHPRAAQRQASSRNVIYGPYLAVRRLLRENPVLQVHPFGEMPWSIPGKSNWSSLAILSRRRH